MTLLSDDPDSVPISFCALMDLSNRSWVNSLGNYPDSNKLIYVSAPACISNFLLMFILFYLFIFILFIYLLFFWGGGGGGYYHYYILSWMLSFFIFIIKYFDFFFMIICLPC